MSTATSCRGCEYSGLDGNLICPLDAELGLWCLRTKSDREHVYLEGEDLEWVQAMAKGGAPMLFSAQPESYWRQRGNYT
eukprot:2827718-Pyramimonas_sp.AAC.1